MVTSRSKTQEQGAKLLAMSKIPEVENWLREVNAAIREYLIIYIARGDSMANDISDEKFSSVQEVMIEHLTRLPLGLLAKNDVRVRLWLAEQLTPDMLQNDLTMTVSEAGGDYGRRSGNDKAEHPEPVCAAPRDLAGRPNAALGGRSLPACRYAADAPAGSGW